MNNTRIPFDSYAYKPPNMQAYRNPALQAQYRNLSNSRMQSPAYSRTRGYIPQMPNSGEASRTIIFVVLGILIVAIVGWIILNFLLYEKDSGWFKVYKSPPPPSGSIQPNGDGTGGSLDPAVTTFKNANLTSYKGLNPSTTPENFGGYITTPPLQP